MEVSEAYRDREDMPLRHEACVLDEMAAWAYVEALDEEGTD